MEKPKMWPAPPPATPNPVSDSDKNNWQRWLRRGPVQNFVTIRLGVSFPRMHDFAHQKCLLGIFLFSSRFEGFLQLATTKATGRILTKNTPKHAVPRKGVPFGGREHTI